jgi:3-oxoacyl-[acyl-carrier-protein] synthase III
MARSQLHNINIQAMISVLPSVQIDNRDILQGTAGQRIMNSTGIFRRRIAAENETALSMSLRASEQLLLDNDISRQQCQLVVVVTQTPDYMLPGNAVQLQHALGLTKETVAFDVNLGCSGFIFGLWQIAQLIQSIDTEHALLVVGDTTSKLIEPNNPTVSCLFGDAVCVTLLTKAHIPSALAFHLGSDGSGAPYLIQPNGGAKLPGIRPNLFMDGTQVFAFTLREVVKSITQCLDTAEVTLDDVDLVVMHQANKMMLEKLASKLGVAKEKVLINMQDVGNVSSASIPLAMCMASERVEKAKNLLLVGFGVGWSWGSVFIRKSSIQAKVLCEPYLPT